MRLHALEHGHRLPARAFIRLAELVSRQRMDNVALTAMHRPEFWGRPFLAILTTVLRGPSYWTPGEREYMAMHVSRLNECPFCLREHTEITRIESHGEVDPEDPSGMRPELAVTLTLLEKLTRSPDAVTSADVVEVRSVGVPDDAVVDALHVMMIFNTVNRMANALDWGWDSDDHVRVTAKVLHRLGYRLPGFTLR
jgi:uncharacterized peroxidase-related enzyme